MSSLLRYFRVPRLQVALDLLDLDRALDIACKCVEGGADVLEAGTPLIKSCGIKAVKRIKTKFPDKLVFADMKTLDLGDLESKMAFENGADIVGIAGVATDITIEKALETAKKFKKWICVDLIGTRDPFKRAIEVSEMGAHIVGLHVSVDEQRRLGKTAEELRDLIEDVSSKIKSILAVAGGIDEFIAKNLVNRGVKLIIVGSRIIKSKDPLLATKKILNSMGRV